MEDWQNGQESPRAKSIKNILVSLDANDSAYLAGEKTREEWIAEAKQLDDRLTVAGLRLASRPWAQSGR